MHSPSPFPPPSPRGSARASPARIAAALAGLLAARGLTRVYTAACELFAVISVTAGLTAWTNGRQLWVTYGGEPETRPPPRPPPPPAPPARPAPPRRPPALGR